VFFGHQAGGAKSAGKQTAPLVRKKHDVPTDTAQGGQRPFGRMMGRRCMTQPPLLTSGAVRRAWFYKVHFNSECSTNTNRAPIRRRKVHIMLRAAALHSVLRRTFCTVVDDSTLLQHIRSPGRSTGSLLRGSLAVTTVGLAPTSRRQLYRAHQRLFGPQPPLKRPRPHHHASTLSPSTSLKCASRATRVKSFRSAIAAIQTSFSGTGRPFCRSLSFTSP